MSYLAPTVCGDRKGYFFFCALPRHEETFLEAPQENPLNYMATQNKAGVLLGRREGPATTILYITGTLPNSPI